jgi:hypothetical protein
VKATARSLILTIALIAVTYLALSFWFSSPADRHALLVSAILAAIVQTAAFSLLHMAGRTNALIAWGLGSVFRGTVLILYGFFLAKMIHLPLTPALLSFAVFLFVSMLLESVLIAL